METTYSISAAGAEEFMLFPRPPEAPAPSAPGPRESDMASDYRSGRPETGGGPTRKRVKKSRYTERQQGLRRLQVREFARDHYLAVRGAKPSEVENVSTLMGHLARCRGQTTVKELSDELCFCLRDYFLTLIADGEMGTRQANKNLRYLKAIGNDAQTEHLVRDRLTFRAFLPEARISVQALTPEQYWKIGQTARAVTGSVAGVPAGLWWFAWYLVMSRIGNRLTAMMLARRGDYQHGVLWLREENQKQHADQRLQLPEYAWPAIEDLLAAHDQERLFPWPYDQRPPDKRPNWKTLYAHFRRLVLKPAGVTLRKGVLTRVFRQTVATRIDAMGGDATKQLGHSSPAITKKHYLDPRQAPVTKGALLIPEDRPPAPPPGKQQTLFAKDDAA